MRPQPHMLLLSLFALISVTPAFAQSEPMSEPSPSSLSMHHLSVTTTPPVQKKEEAKPAEKPTPPEEEKPAPKALKTEDALKKTDTLVAWPYYTDLMTSNNDAAIDKVVHMIDIDPGSVPPKGLLYMAKALADRKRYEEAAFYYYAGQLRANFDMARFPPYSYEDKAAASDKRTEDQKGDVPDAGPVLINPHEPLSMLAISIGAPISKWAMADPDRLDKVMDKVRAWDLATPYAYLPDYDISHARPFETWPQLLATARSDYFTRVRQISSGLKTVRPDTPAPSFAPPQ